MQEEVILVNENDEEIGLMEKMEAHEKGLLHRAFSVFLFNTNGELLLQKRALTKYHSAGLWTNTCCSHPRKGESILNAASRRLKEEMGVSCALEIADKFIYRAEFSNGLTEHELDYIVTGQYNQTPEINPDEVCDYKWIAISELLSDLKNNPKHYTEWFKIILDRHLSLLTPNGA